MSLIICDLRYTIYAIHRFWVGLVNRKSHIANPVRASSRRRLLQFSMAASASVTWGMSVTLSTPR